MAKDTGKTKEINKENVREDNATDIRSTIDAMVEKLIMPCQNL